MCVVLPHQRTPQSQTVGASSQLGPAGIYFLSADISRTKQYRDIKFSYPKPVQGNMHGMILRDAGRKGNGYRHFA